MQATFSDPPESQQAKRLRHSPKWWLWPLLSSALAFVGLCPPPPCSHCSGCADSKMRLARSPFISLENSPKRCFRILIHFWNFPLKALVDQRGQSLLNFNFLALCKLIQLGCLWCWLIFPLLAVKSSSSREKTRLTLHRWSASQGFTFKIAVCVLKTGCPPVNWYLRYSIPANFSDCFHVVLTGPVFKPMPLSS